MLTFQRSLIFVTVMMIALSCDQNSMQKETTCCSSANNVQNEVENEELPGGSIYHFNHEWTDANKETIRLADFTGKPVVITMIYTHCGYACPMMMQDLKKIAAQFSGNEQLPFELVLISFDHLRDTPERLKNYASDQELSTQWHLLHGDADQIKELSVALGISFEIDGEGNISHGNKKLLLNSGGEIVFEQNGLETDTDVFAEQIRALY